MENTQEAKEKIEEVKHQVIHAIGETMDLYGVTPSIGRLYGTMYFEDRMTLDEMRLKLKMSKPSMSTGVRKLEENDMVRKVWEVGTRKHMYEAEKNFFNTFVSFFCNKWMREVKINSKSVSEGKEKLKTIIENPDVDESIIEEARRIYNQLLDSEQYYKWLERLVKSFESGEIFDFIPMDNQKNGQES